MSFAHVRVPDWIASANGTDVGNPEDVDGGLVAGTADEAVVGMEPLPAEPGGTGLDSGTVVAQAPAATNPDTTTRTTTKWATGRRGADGRPAPTVVLLRALMSTVPS